MTEIIVDSSLTMSFVTNVRIQITIAPGSRTRYGEHSSFRNTFAHSYLSLELAAAEVCQLVDMLIPPTIHRTLTVEGEDAKLSGPAPMPLPGSPRDKFNTIVITMVNRLLLTGLAEKHRQRQLKGWE